MSPPKALILVSNGISAEMARAAINEDGYVGQDCVLISGRNLSVDWLGDFSRVVMFKGKPRMSAIGQVNIIGFYYASIRLVKGLLREGSLKDIYVVNNDNIISNHILEVVRCFPSVRVTVLTEGLMNYQDIGIGNRSSWRWKVKPFISRVVGLKYRQPEGHLSGAFDDRVDRVIAYSSIGLKAPPEKVSVIPFPSAKIEVQPSDNEILVLITGIKQWMTDEDFRFFKAAFQRWINSLGAEKVWIKPHPNYPSGGVEDGILNARVFPLRSSIESIAGQIPSKKVVGFCTTGLVTLKLIRPDLECLDFGSDFYCEAAYGGDRSVIDVLRNGGVEIVNF